MVSQKFKALMWKHFIVRRRKCCELLFEILAPIAPIMAVYLLKDLVHQRHVNQQARGMMENEYFRTNPVLIERASTSIADKTYEQTMKMVVGYTLFAGPLIVFSFLMTRLLNERASGIRELVKLAGASSTIINVSHFLNAMPGCIVFCIVTTAAVRVGDRALLPNVNLGLFFFGILLHFISLLTAAFFFTYLSKEAEYSASLVLFVYIAMWVPVRLFNFTSKSKILLVLIGLFPHAPSYWLLEELTAGKDVVWDIHTIWESHVKYPNGAKCGSIGAVYVALGVQIAITAFLAWYLDKIRPGLYGVSLPWYFLIPNRCQRILWKNRAKKVYRDDDPNFDKTAYERYFEPEPSGMYPGIRVEAVTKEFIDYETIYRALTDVTFNVYRGEITVLLGHNGAGKSTIISIITGLMNATFGEVYINDKNTATKHEEIRPQLGLCPQHNLNFPDLNIIEHFVFFTMLKGYDYTTSFNHSKLLLSKLRLLPKWSSMPSELAGGILRRLQLGCALSGKAEVLILDEPTSGLDLQARREMWDILLSLRGRRTILLTTHFMEEADVLADRIIALHAGRLHCHATPSFLKTAFGTGFRLTIKTIGPPNEAAMTQCIQKSVPSARLLDSTPNSLVYDLPVNKHLTQMFDKIEMRKNSLRMQSIAIGISTSLEDVFMNLCRDVDIANLDENIISTPPEQFECHNGCALDMQRICTLILRQLEFTTSRCLTVLFLQVLLPALMMFALTQLFNDAKSASSFSFRSQVPELDIYGLFGDNFTDLIVGRESAPVKFLRTLNISSNILNNETMIAQYKEIMLALLRNATLLNYIFNDILKDEHVIFHNLRKRGAEDDSKELDTDKDKKIDDSDDVIMRVTKKNSNDNWNELTKLKRKIDQNNYSTHIKDRDVMNIDNILKVDTRIFYNAPNYLNNTKSLNSQELEGYSVQNPQKNTTNKLKTNNISKSNALNNKLNNTVHITNSQESIIAVNITNYDNSQIIHAQADDIYKGNTQDPLNGGNNYKISNLIDSSSVDAQQVSINNVHEITKAVFQPTVQNAPAYDQTDPKTAAENANIAVDNPNITDHTVKNILNEPINSVDDFNISNITNNINTLNILDNFDITHNNIRNIRDTMVKPNLKEKKVGNNLVGLNYSNITNVNIINNPNIVDESNTTNNQLEKTATALDDLNITHEHVLNIQVEKVKNTMDSLNYLINLNNSVEALKYLKNIENNFKSPLDGTNLPNLTYSNVKNDLNTTNYNFRNTRNTIKSFNMTGYKKENLIKVLNNLNINKNNIGNILNTLSGLNVISNKTINIRNALILLEALNVTHYNVYDKTEIENVKQSLRNAYAQKMQYGINEFLSSLLRQDPIMEKHPKSLMNCAMFAIFNIFIIITAALNNTALPTRERITIVRHIHLMTGCSSIIYWSVTFVYHMILYLLFSVFTAVYAVITFERDHTLDNPSFTLSYSVLLMFGGMAFHMFAYFTTFFFSEHSVSMLLIVLQIIYGLLFPIFTVSVSDLVDLNSFHYNLYFYLTELTGAFLPAHTFVTAVLKLTNVARFNRFCEINLRLCPSSIPQPYEVKKFDAQYCCSKGQTTKGRPFNNFSFIYGAGYHFLMVIFQLFFYAVLILALQDGVFDRWYTRYVKKNLDATPHRFKSDSVERERLYVNEAYDKLIAEVPNDQLLLRNVSVVYPKSLLSNYIGLNDVSLAVKKGECLGILGVSGAGKTTLFRAIASEKQHIDGNIYVKQYEKNLHRKKYPTLVGYCPQFHGVDYFRTGNANITTLLTLRGLTPSHTRRESSQWMASVGMTKYGNKLVSQYSGGMVRRLVTATSLCAGTPVSILDEPTTGVDTAARRLVWAAMRRGLLNDRAIVFTSHGADELEILSSRLLFIGAGEIMVIGTPASLRNEFAPGHTVGLKFNTSEVHTIRGRNDINKVKETMDKLFDCTLKEEHMTTLTYRINKKLSYCRTFAILENMKREFHALLEEYTVSNTDIEDVFFSFKEQHKKKTTSTNATNEGAGSSSDPVLPTSDPQERRMYV